VLIGICNPIRIGLTSSGIVKGRGKGGRNQELALVAALEMHERAMSDQAVLLSAGTDGQVLLTRFLVILIAWYPGTQKEIN